MNDIQLSPHFKLSEFTYSATAIRLGIDNSLDATDPAHAAVIANLRNLCQEVLEPLRTFANSPEGKPSSTPSLEIPVMVSSGYRCPALNRAVGGSTNSQHMTGEACDIHLTDTIRLRSWFHWLRYHTSFDQLILEHTSADPTHFWIHVSCRHAVGTNRHQVLYLTKE